MSKLEHMLKDQPDLGKTGKLLGAYYTQLSSSMFFIGLLNTMLIIITAWHTTISYYTYVISWLSWLNIWWFMSITLVIFALIIPWVYYKYILRGIMVFQNEQIYTHGNPFAKELKEVKEELKEIRKEIREKMNK